MAVRLCFLWVGSWSSGSGANRREAPEPKQLLTIGTPDRRAIGPSAAMEGRGSTLQLSLEVQSATKTFERFQHFVRAVIPFRRNLSQALVIIC